jgi:RNA polymerase sigma factor (sigma-70 family)
VGPYRSSFDRLFTFRHLGTPWETDEVNEGPDRDVERLYRDHGERLWRAVLAFSGNPEVASDAVSEAFAQVLRRGDAVRDPLAWVWRVAFRVAAGELADRRRTGGGGDVPEESYEAPDSARDLVGALAQLSPSQRAALVLHHYAGYPVKDVARMIGSTGAAVRVHLSRGRKRLRQLLRKDDHA